MKKIKKSGLKLLLSAILLFTAVFSGISFDTGDSKFRDIERITHEIFGDVKIKSNEYL